MQSECLQHLRDGKAGSRVVHRKHGRTNLRQILPPSGWYNPDAGLPGWLARLTEEGFTRNGDGVLGADKPVWRLGVFRAAAKERNECKHRTNAQTRWASRN